MVTIGNSVEENGLKVNIDHEALVALTADTEKSGFVSLVAEKGILPDGSRVLRELETTEDYQLRIGTDNFWIVDFPIGTVVNTRKFANLLSASQTITAGGGRYELNSSGLVTVNSGSALVSKKFIPFYQANTSYDERAVSWPFDPLANWFAEWGFGNPSTAIAAILDGIFFRVTAGAFRGVLINNGSEISVDLGPLPDTAVVHRCVIEATMDTVYFWVNNDMLGKVVVPNANFGPTSQEALPIFSRTYNGTIAPSAMNKLQISAQAASNGGGDVNRLWPTVQTGMGNNGIQAPSGTAVGQTSNNVNITGPVSAVLANATAGYATKGGQFQFAAVAGAETDYALFAYQVPAGKTLMIRGVWIDTANVGAAVATTPTVLQWTIGVGATAVTLLTADGAATKSAARLNLGLQSFAIADPIGKLAQRLDINFDVPQCVNSGEYVHIILKIIAGTATASQVIRGIVGFNDYFE